MLNGRALILAMFWGSLTIPGAFAGPDSAEVAQKVDSMILEALTAEGIAPAPLTKDEDFLRRVSLDLGGDIPSPEEVTLFGLNPDPQKRTAKIEEMLKSEKYAEIWASYWKDVIFLRATEMRARINQRAFERWLQEQLASNRSWGDIATDLLTATGDVQEDGQVGLMFAHTGDPQELTAEIGRIFLGIQLSCANCHDHPTDQWKREQFHQLAAFLPRVSVRREDPQNPASFIVTSFNQGPVRGNLEPGQLLRFMDRNGDGKLAKTEARGPLAERFDDALGRADADKDGMLNAQELANVRPPMDQPGRGSAEYYMPDLNDPTSQGKMMQPVFFLEEVKGPKLPAGADDTTRRNALAAYVTSKSNPWFAKAFVNRIWAEMLGEGFYMPIDDMGPERQAQMEEVLSYLAKSFANSDYDIKWLFRTIAMTEAYQRQIRSVDLTEENPVPFAAAAPTRLRSDQIYHALQEILGVSSGPAMAGRMGGGNPAQMMAARAGLDPVRMAFGELFGFDPSTPQEDLLGNVPQALFLMNSPQLATAVSARSGTRLGNILKKYSHDDDAINEVYLLVLSREPSDKELTIATEHIASVGQRAEGFEDLFWSLLNSTEFISKR